MYLKRYLFPLLLIVSATSYANKEATPEIDAYLAKPANKSIAKRVNESLSWLDNFYLGAKYAYTDYRIKDVTGGTFNGDLSIIGLSSITLTPTNTDESETETAWSIAFGYAFESLSFPSRIEFAYWNFNTVPYTTDINVTSTLPIPATVTLSSDVQSQVLLLNMYYDADFGIYVMPYIGLGGGFSYIETKSTVLTNNGRPLLNTKRTRFDFAFDAQAGLRYRYKSLVIEGGYQFTMIGKTKWPLFMNSKLTSDYSIIHSFFGGLTWQFGG